MLKNAALLNGPYQPDIDCSTVQKTQGKQSHIFQKRWFTEYKWLTFCAICYHGISRKVTLSKKCDEALISRGYNNWKKATEKFKEHEKIQCHLEACMMHKSPKGPSVICILNSQAREEQKKAKVYASKATFLSQVSHAPRISCPRAQ